MPIDAPAWVPACLAPFPSCPACHELPGKLVQNRRRLWRLCVCVCVVGHKFVCMIGSNNFICLRLCSLPKQPTSDRRRRCCCLCLGAVASLIRPDDSADFVAPVRSCGQQELPELGVHSGSCCCCCCCSSCCCCCSSCCCCRRCCKAPAPRSLLQFT